MQVVIEVLFGTIITKLSSHNGSLTQERSNDKASINSVREGSVSKVSSWMCKEIRTEFVTLLLEKESVNWSNNNIDRISVLFMNICTS